ncbi:MAG: amino acid ABC transporter permease [Burkholderiales bacterium]
MLEIIRDNWLFFLIGQYPYGPLGGLALTLLLAGVSLLLAVPGGLLLGLGRVSHFAFIRYPVTALVYLVRGTPLLMVIFWAYFLVPLWLGKNIPGFVTMICALSFFSSAYLAEIIRGGIEGVPHGQTEAARAGGLNYLQTMRHVVLPQALRNMLPSLVNQFVSLTKDTSLAFIVGVSELTYVASQINNRTLTKPAEIFFLIAVMYFILCFSLTTFSRYLEQRLAWGHK